MSAMLEISEACAKILEHVGPAAPSDRLLGSEVLGLVLAQDAVSDLDSPPFDKSMMDGFAVRSADATGNAELAIVGEVLAGQVPSRSVDTGTAIRIMTGAPIPDGADAVVMIERTEAIGDQRVRIRDAAKANQNIMRRATEMRRGETIVTAGTRLRPEEIGLLAAIGQDVIRVHPRPSVALLPTGDEVVEVNQTPGPGQIRNSNGRMLLAQVARAGGEPRWIGIAPDHRERLRDMIALGLESDMLVLSGGVSAGKADLVPGVFAELGVQAIFHKVRLKPGKPMLFGRLDRPGRSTTFVFGLPGNPVSSLVCFELFVRPAIRRWMNLPPGPRIAQATMAEVTTYRTDRPTYHPAQLTLDAGRLTVRPVPWFGSPDLRGVAGGNAFVVFEAGDRRYDAGQIVPVLVVDEM
jgi:molybdopterin molybdotransferase